MILSMGSWSLMHFVDRVFLTWYSRDALAAALPSGILSFTLGTFFLGTAGYVNTFVAQYMGANRPERGGASVWQGIHFSILAGLFLLVGIPFAPWIFDAAGHAPSRGTQLAPMGVAAAQAGPAAGVAPGACGPNLPAAQVAVHAATPALEQPAPLCRPAGQSAQALQPSCVAVPP